MLTQTDANLGPAPARTPIIAAAIVGAFILLSGVLYTRGASTTPTQPARPANAEKNADVVAYYGNGRLKVLSFYANPVEVKRGTRALVCYGVANASTVTIEPAIGETWPSTSRCLETTAAKDTEYRLTATDAAGHQEIRTVALRVAR